ncbi:PTPLA-domain-containing protein [Stemphylium lycopersici]|uniref:Very-long-chain (3R)-3-hydroxyacyl-CoA dehydratase n=1 Tax=Stemphylium lycopersici TaxID=183478 RepID=A0A364N9L7_STELY|nr:protein tyrosine phosphatase-like protein [Stemphylium lycopersici]RAR03956.1 PTPLA-domain-containing protein [Stemphylium lycopersici]RAR13887.1 PTPLA-domain-containing protein [Stemphylium lycopersici]
MANQRNERQAPAASMQPRTLYLTAYNILFASLWASVFVRAISHLSDSKTELFTATEPQARWIQTASLIEVLHAAFGIIKSPVSTTALQVVTRVIQVWMVWYSFPGSTATSHAYLALLLAWSVADTIRYLYLALNMHGKAPKGLVWLRYTMFYPLYPIGIGAEWWLLYRAIAPGAKVSPVIPPILYFCLLLYIPGYANQYLINYLEIAVL